ncbi:MAG: DNA (cytosine-5-)-methyltransferase [Porphyromonadaceae bacterium]|nr:DNA (cytosine-5-)-methyltransferase [Porphyromonadaceae bacterium]
MRDRTMTHASLCTGIGACELAATWMGWENLFSCEIDEFCNKVLKYHYPNSVHYGNIFEQDFREWRGRVDVLTAGFPCQPFSCAGKRNGAEDDRYLWPEVLRVINEVRPTWFIGENVGGIITMVLPGEETKVGSYTDVCGENYTFYEKRQRFVIEQIRIDLASIGYSVQPVVIPACAVGAPHRRDRVWFLARRDDVTDTGGAGLQETGTQQRAAGVAGDGLQRDVANPNGYRFRIRENKQKHITECQGETNDRACRETGITSHSPEQGLQERLDNGRHANAEETRTGMVNRFERHGGKRATPDPDGKRRHDGSDNREKRRVRANEKRGVTEDKPERDERECRVSKNCSNATAPDDKRSEELDAPEISNWQNFPTQFPVCNGNDGISLGLSGITFSRWRQESIKALGNSMVAPLVYEIFLAIEQVEQIK